LAKIEGEMIAHTQQLTEEYTTFFFVNFEGIHEVHGVFNGLLIMRGNHDIGDVNIFHDDLHTSMVAVMRVLQENGSNISHI